MLRTITARLAVTAGAALAATLVSVPSANAHWGHYEECPLGRFCAWEGDHADGRRAQWQDGLHDSYWGDGAAYYMNNNAESIHNWGWSGDAVRTFLDANYYRPDSCVVRGDYADWSMTDNAVSSHRWVGSCNP